MTDILYWTKALASCYVDGGATSRFRQLLRGRSVRDAMVASTRAFAQFLQTDPPEWAILLAAGNWMPAERVIQDGERLAPPVWQERMDEARARAYEGVAWLREPNVRLAGIGAFLVGATIHLRLLYEASQRSRGELTALGAAVRDYTSHVQGVAEEIRGQVGQKYTLQEFDGSGREETWQGSRWRPRRIARKLKRLVGHSVGKAETPTEPEMYEYRVDGQLVGIFEFPEASLRRKHDLSRHVDPTIALLLQMVDGWQDGWRVESIRRAYNRILERPADSDGVNGFLPLLRVGANERFMIRELALSEEHRTTFVKPHPPEQAVRILSHHLLGRTVDPVRLNRYKAVFLQQGLEALVDEILDSDDFQMRFGDDPIASSQGNGAVREVSVRAP